jgi:hypothetical protein
VKRSSLLIASLGLNLLLAAAALALRPASRLPAAAVAAAVAAPRSSREPAVPSGNLAALSPAPTVRTNRFHWRQVESDDYRQYVANLRAIDCPERLVRDILLADIESLFQARHRALDDAPPAFEPWTGQRQRKAVMQARRARAEALELEKRALIKDLLGIEWSNSEHDWEEESMVALLLGFLPQEKAPQLMGLIENSTAAARRVRDAADGILIAEDYARLDAMRAELFQQLGQLLTPAELEETHLRAQLFKGLFGSDLHTDGVALSGAEFRELIGLTRAVHDVLEQDLIEPRARDDAEEDEARREEQFQQQVARLLGPARFADFLYAQKSEFRDAYEFTQEHHLPKAAAARICDTLTGAHEQAEQIVNDTSLSREEQAAALTVLQATTKNTIASTLGTTGADYLVKLESTLDNLAQLPEPPRPASP